MKKKYIVRIILVTCLVLFSITGKSQQINTMYFMDNVPVRSFLNPAFQPQGSFYFGLPLIGLTQFDLGNNSLVLKDIIYNQNGQTILFKNPNADYNLLYNSLKSPWTFNTDLQLNLLDFGFRTGKSWWSFSLTEKINSRISIPKDLTKLLLYGTPDLYNNYFDLKNLGVDMSVFTEAGIGFSRQMNDFITIGAKLKLNIGTANLYSQNQNFDINANITEWNINGKGTLNTSLPISYTLGNDFQSFGINTPAISDFTKPNGMGAGIDLGFTLKPFDNFTFSAAVTDLGFISWTQNVKNINYKANYTFGGFGNFNINTDVAALNLADTILNALSTSFSNTQTSNSYTTYTSPKLNIGAEYGFFNNKLSLGILSRTTKYYDLYDEEITASINGRPTNWLNMSVSYSAMNGRMSNIGAGIGIRTGFVNWMLSADYIPLNYVAFPVSQPSGLPTQTIPVPYNTQGVNLALGINFVFGFRKDADKDGIVDRKDKCPDTPFGVIVDKKGCPVDTDGDGVPDYLDKCPGTPKEAYGKIDEHGCPLDSDGDGVPDYLDKCPGTPKSARGHVDKNGCVTDSDKDGVPDFMDKCPNTPLNVKIDSIGCPLDSDGDGVPDYLDKCPATPKEAKGLIDKNGCPIDTDGDGVPDYLDKCPTVKGTAANHGCEEIKPVVKPEVKPEINKPSLKPEINSLFQKALQGIQFESGNDHIVVWSKKILNQIAGVMIANPDYKIEIRGYTDNQGKPEANKILSQKRAESVKKYLVQKGVPVERMTANGYGETLPIDTNKTEIGRSHNRRVEFIVSYKEITFD
jgi:outer membrane protein OmpA-like peptidoglycan-associated protein